MVGGFGHIPVLAEEVAAGLGLGPGATYVDCTAGLGGHAARAAGAVAPGGRVVLCDLDPGNLAAAGERVRGAAPGVEVVEIRGNFASLPRVLEREGILADAVLADLGFASTQMDDPARGFAFSRDGPLDMRLDPAGPTTAAELVATLPEGELVRLLREYGEERAARAIARKLVAARREGSIATTAQLAEIVRSVVKPGGSIDPATRTFQALRIAVNDELGSLEGLLAGIERGAKRRMWLAEGARVGIVSFHSLEDRLVKRSFAGLIGAGLASAVGAQPTTPTGAETAANPRSRSAKLRVIRLELRAAEGTLGRIGV
ncbi:MAG: 16S rRNA (cytosine(1402)-N(4))-methyltransferase RsmH [Phycisphaerales bacterium]|nr:16S rRNA (cytosine(1402)-N(4))-methyltransferase RsmH [Phycisphaerales bacterium]